MGKKHLFRLITIVTFSMIALSAFLLTSGTAFASTTPGCVPSTQAVIDGTTTVGTFTVTCTVVDQGVWFIHDYVTYINIKLTLTRPWKMKPAYAGNSELTSVYTDSFKANSKPGELWILKKDLGPVNYQSGFDVYTRGSVIVLPITGCQPDNLGISPCDS